MAQALIEAARIGHELVPALHGQEAASFGRFITNWVQQNPGQAQQVGNAITRWIGENVPALANNAIDIANNAITRLRESDMGDIVLGAAGGFTGGILGGPAGIIPGAIAGVNARGRFEETGQAIQDSAPNNAMSRWEPLTNQHSTTLDNLLPSGNMEEGPSEPVAEASAARIAGPGGNTVSKETPISNYPSLTYGLQETHTTVLPWVGWISAAGLDKNTPLQLKLRMNAPYDMLDLTTQSLPSEGGRYSTKGFYSAPVDHQGRYSDSSITQFPVQFGSGASTAHERPQWRDFWTRLYDFYTVLGCEWEVIAHNPIQVKNIEIVKVPGKLIESETFLPVLVPVENGTYNSDIVIAEQYDSYSDTATSTGNVMPLTYYEEVRAFKNIKWHSVPGGRKAVLRGHYRPGQIKRNIVNDGDVKTWTATGPTLPNLKEILTLNFFCDPFFNARKPDSFDSGTSIEPDETGSSLPGAVNLEIKLKYIVQYKDLKLQARYPNSITTDQDIQLNLNENIGDKGNPLMSWTTATAS